MPEWLRQVFKRPESSFVPFPPEVYRENTYRPADQKQPYVPRIQYEPSAKPFQPRRLLKKFPFYTNRQYRPEPRDFPDVKSFKNSYINGTSIYKKNRDGTLCVKCGKLKQRFENV